MEKKPAPRSAETLNVLIKRIIDHPAISAEALLELIKLQNEKSTVSAEVQIASIQAQLDNNKPWFRWVPWTVLFTVVGSIATAVLTGGIEVIKTRDESDQAIALEQSRYQSSVFGQLLIVENPVVLNDKAEMKKERKARVCLAANFGLVRVPDYLLNANSNDTKAYAQEMRTFLDKRYGCDTAGVPTDLPAPITLANVPLEETSCPRPTSELAQNRLSVPEELQQNNARDRMLKAALQELNNGVHEVCQSNRIGKYWETINLNHDGQSGVPWSAAFTSWVITQGNSKRSIQLGAAHYQIWTSALREKMTELPGEYKPTRGDFIFFARPRDGADVANAVSIARKGSDVFLPMSSGIIYSVIDGVIIYISGNHDDAVQFNQVLITDKSIVGFVKF